MIRKNLNFFKFLLIIFFQFITLNIASADQIKNISVNGNDRVANETVIMFSNLEIGSSINQNILNNALKEIYLT